MATIGWQKWADLIVDFGLQAYVPWQLSEGQTLHADIVYFTGPFSVYLHALVFKVFGTSIMILSLFNLFLIACLAWLIYSIFQKSADSTTAFLCALIFVLVFAFGQYSRGGNFNFVNPYVYELTHGVFLSFLALYQLQKYMVTRNPGRIIAIGVTLGAVFLTKPEASLAAITAITIGVFLAVYIENVPKRVFIKKVFLLFASMSGLPLAFLLYFSMHMPMIDAIKGVLGQWLYVVGSSAFRNMDYYKWIRGTDDISGNTLTMVLYGIIFIATVGSAFIINHRLRKFSGNTTLLNILIGLIVIGLSTVFYSRIPFGEALKPLPLLLLGFGIYLFIVIKANLQHRELLTQKIPLITLVVFSFVLLFKMILNVHVYHYGFALAMPATLVIAAVFFYEIPLWIKKVSGPTHYYRSIAGALILVFIFSHASLSYRIYQLNGYPVGKGKDVIQDYWLELSPRGKIFNQALKFIDQEMGPDQAFATIPNANMLNYQAKRKSPLKTLGYTLGTWQFLGESYTLDLLKQNPPLYIAFVDRYVIGFGVQGFSRGYGMEIYSWILQNYKTIRLFGKMPFAKKGFGIQILKRRSSTPPD